uniref:SAM domain sterile alpha motif protein n=1 Tax=Marseillevirus LCMAC101 TaxID=2506602 RepID=A0A481YSL0_9VIRU|nr:MAG: SAM domain sterile alpha motif protein [Marseillevirus LCMAC101]
MDDRRSERPLRKKGRRDGIDPPVFRIQIFINEKISQWTVKDVEVFLKKNTMTKYCKEFRKNYIEGEDLLDLTIEEFQMLGLKYNEAKELFQSLKSYKEIIQK